MPEPLNPNDLTEEEQNALDVAVKLMLDALDNNQA